MNFVDRIGDRFVEQPPARTLFGRWLVSSGEELGSVYLNGCPVSDGDVLVPGATENWTFVRSDDTPPVRGNFLADALPDEQDTEALLQLGELLRNSDKAQGGWLEWGNISPLALGLDEAVKPHPLEDSIERELNHLVAVCRNPRTHIRVETERVLVARARRITPDAPVWLASHTEDWDHRKITGIQPRRILAEVREEQWNLYENRIAVRLVDALVTWLRRRIAKVRRILDDIFVRMEDFGASASGTRHRANRIYRLWGKAYDTSHGREVADRTLRRLEHLLYKVLGLMDSRLYQRIPRRAQAPKAIRMTNLLSNDDHYRGVTRLWHHWSREAAQRTLSSHERYARYQNLHHGFDAWCMLVIVRACSQLKLDPAEDEDWEAALQPGHRIRLAKGFQLEWERAGTITLADEDKKLLRFVPLVHVLEHAKTREAVTARIASLAGSVVGATHWTVVLHPAISGRPPYDVLASVGNPPHSDTRGAIDFIRVSPFSLDSVERVSRAIRWATLAPRMLAYPPTLKTIKEPRIEAIANKGRAWLVDHGESHWALICPLRPNELAELNVEKRLAEACDRRDKLKHERQDSKEKLQRRPGKGGELLESLRKAEDDVKQLQAFKREFESAHSKVTALAECPACGSEEVSFKPREKHCFAAHCQSESCTSRWELRHDPETSRRIPVLFRDSPSSAIPSTNVAPQRVDDILGCDVLAVPIALEGGDIDFLPPRKEPR